MKYIIFLLFFISSFAYGNVDNGNLGPETVVSDVQFMDNLLYFNLPDDILNDILLSKNFSYSVSKDGYMDNIKISHAIGRCHRHCWVVSCDALSTSGCSYDCDTHCR